ncbi:MAG: GNAT family N-acetyltransferase [Chloroflexi bacterium]|nr:GNAT family N-acetyltransferase [Chloroflexota bacterium]
MAEPELRRARDGDVTAIGRLVDAAYEGYRPLLGRTPTPMLTDFAAAVRDHDVWILDGDEGPAAVIELIVPDDHLWVHNVAVEPSRQGNGLGRRLLRFAEDEARRLELPAIGLLTNERYLENIAMYERYGYRETHREPYRGTDLIHFRKVLEGPSPDRSGHGSTTPSPPASGR